jgi:cyclic-di-GMP-binding protein
MAGNVSFDVVSEFDRQELVNAIDQVRREIATRFDFKGAKAQVDLLEKELVIITDSEMRAATVQDLVITKAIRRGLSVKVFDWGKVEPAGGMTFRQRAALRQGLPEDVARKISKLVRDEFPKLHAQVQGDAVRVSGKSKDELQALIARLREVSDEYPVALQYQNYR